MPARNEAGKVTSTLLDVVELGGFSAMARTERSRKRWMSLSRLSSGLRHPNRHGP